jgi:hypothetical protein
VAASEEPAITSTEAGIEISRNQRQEENTLPLMRVSLEPDSKVNEESDGHDEKEQAAIKSTESGRQIEANLECRKTVTI